jgi:peptidoglycan/xylan/chitin deacetylase (PgdA/CDA1 family)
MYHSLDENMVTNYAAVKPQVFYKQMKFLKDKNYKVIPLDDYCRMLKDKKPIPKNIAIITFDDGYRDNLKAIEILKKFDYPATIFVVVDEIGSPNYLTKNNINWLLKNTKVTVGSHTLTHAYLPDLNSTILRREIFDSKKSLEELFKTPVETISYPVGGFNEHTLKEVRSADYLCACTTNRGFSENIDRFALRRIKITNDDRGVSLWVKLSGIYNFFKKPKKPY